MQFFVGIDVSLESSSICVIDERGVIIKEGTAPSEPEEQEPEFPAYQLEGLETLVEADVINSPEFWRQKFGEQVTVGELFGILGKLFTKASE